MKWIILIIFFVDNAFAAKDPCEPLYKNEVDPLVCCNIPLDYASDEIFQKCQIQCEKEKGNLCCETSCIFEHVGTFRNGKFNETAFKASLNIQDLHGLGKLEIDDEWKNTIDDVVGECRKTYKNLEAEERDLECMNENFNEFNICVLANLYASCPTKHQKPLEVCKNIIKAVGDCNSDHELMRDIFMPQQNEEDADYVNEY